MISSHSCICFHVLQIMRLRSYFNQFTSYLNLEKFKMSSQEWFAAMSYLFLRDVRGLHTRYERMLCIMSTGRKKIFLVSFRRDGCEITYNCHLFEFRGIICTHAIIVLICNDVTLFPERYIMQRWRSDVSKTHTRVTVNYNGLVSTLEQLRYNDMC